MTERLTEAQKEALGSWNGARRLVHYSASPLVAASSRRQDEDFKPTGLWVSVLGPDDWPSWCIAEGFRTERLACAALVTPVPEANLLHLATPWAIKVFTHLFKVPSSFDRADLVYSINWSEVAARWDGIIISPYQWSCRNYGGTRWYYSWDCASGCIWNAQAIESVANAPDLVPDITPAGRLALGDRR